MCDLAAQPRSSLLRGRRIAYLVPGPREGRDSCSSRVAPTVWYARVSRDPDPAIVSFAVMSAASLVSLRRCNASLHDIHR